MGGRTSLAVDGGKPTPLENLPDSGGWENYRWGRAATLRLTAGKHALRWRNDQGGAYRMDVFVLSDDPAWAPSGGAWPSAAPGRHLVVVEAEDFVRADAPQLAFGITDSEPLPKGQKTVFPYGPGDVKPSWADAPEAEVHIWPTFDACRGYKQITRLAKIDAAARTRHDQRPGVRHPTRHRRPLLRRERPGGTRQPGRMVPRPPGRDALLLAEATAEQASRSRRRSPAGCSSSRAMRPRGRR